MTGTERDLALEKLLAFMGENQMTIDQVPSLMKLAKAAVAFGDVEGYARGRADGEAIGRHEAFEEAARIAERCPSCALRSCCRPGYSIRAAASKERGE